MSLTLQGSCVITVQAWDSAKIMRLVCHRITGAGVEIVENTVLYQSRVGAREGPMVFPGSPSTP